MSKGIENMTSLNDDIQEYTAQLQNGQIQRAYKGIMDFMSSFKAHMERKLPEYAASALYQGYMDMTYFALTPPALKGKKLKIAVVYLHMENRFECWLAGANRKVQADYIGLLRGKYIGGYALSEPAPGVDSIIEAILLQQPNFDEPESLKILLELKVVEFKNIMLSAII